VVKLSHGWLPIGVRERRCSATTACCPQCNEIETVPHMYRCQARAPWRHRFLIHLHGHLKENDRTGFSPATALTPSSKSPGFKSSKVTYQKSGLQGKKASIGADATVRTSTTQASSRRKNILSSSRRTATPSGKIGAQSHTHSLPTSGTPTSGNGICTRSAHVSSRSVRSRRPSGRKTAITNL
jgi:hypothetical protein